MERSCPFNKIGLYDCAKITAQKQAEQERLVNSRYVKLAII